MGNRLGNELLKKTVAMKLKAQIKLFQNFAYNITIDTMKPLLEKSRKNSTNKKFIATTKQTSVKSLEKSKNGHSKSLQKKDTRLQNFFSSKAFPKNFCANNK